MKNITISILNDSELKNWTTAISTIHRPAYVFNRLPLISSYVSALVFCLGFLVLGFGALLQNGTPASSGGFLQIMCTTTHSDGAMNQLAKEASLGGQTEVPKKLLDLKVRFGIVTDSTFENRYAAFGTVKDTKEMLKGLSLYACDVLQTTPLTCKGM